ncbi:hypothetical protein [Bacillus amyloliquefaciens]|uniref:hypothetical protein n=1 Tax=Bacillus amyloliquefaciens TaxID=1390 RepID=UPI002FFC7A40
MKALLNRSLNENSALEMIYIKADGTVSKRTIIVHQVKQNFIRAFCFKSRQTKTFRIDNILAVAPANYKKGVRNHA